MNQAHTTKRSHTIKRDIHITCKIPTFSPINLETLFAHPIRPPCRTKFYLVHYHMIHGSHLWTSSTWPITTIDWSIFEFHCVSPTLLQYFWQLKPTTNFFLCPCLRAHKGKQTEPRTITLPLVPLNLGYDAIFRLKRL